MGPNRASGGSHARWLADGIISHGSFIKEWRCVLIGDNGIHSGMANEGHNRTLINGIMILASEPYEIVNNISV